MQGVTTQLATLLMGALALIVPAAAAFCVAWLNQRTETRRQAVLGAAHEIEATSVGVDGPAKKAAAMQLASERLPAGLQTTNTKLGDLVESVMPEVQARAEELRASSVPPQGVGPLPMPDPSSMPTRPDRRPGKG